MAPTSDITTSQSEFDEFLTWLADQQAQGKLVVLTVGDVIGGPEPSGAGTGPDQGGGQPGSAGGPGRRPVVLDASQLRQQQARVLVGPRENGAAERLVMRDYVDGEAKLLPTEDLGTCSIAVSPGQTYTIAAWYTSTVPTSFVVQYRLSRGRWVFGALSPKFQPATAFTQAHWTLQPTPEGVTAISFGLSLSQNGELVTDDYTLTGGSS